ncbi:MAG: TetR/AcrR family transcriptional regulator [Actinomycetota bacterium]|nr:TetR/AcrR family transcriptional regulator [Actinomycetota bacterium]
MPAAPAAREKVLDAFESILVEHGERTATLDAVADAAGVSKGGLLYHFGSKQALVEGLCERLTARIDTDVEKMRAAPEGPAAFYVRTSLYTGSPLDRTIIAASRLAQGSYQSAVEVLRRMRQRWFEVIVESVEDAAVARAVMLLGDGLYYNAALNGDWEPDVSGVAPTDHARADVDELLDVLEDLIRSRASSSE